MFAPKPPTSSSTDTFQTDVRQRTHLATASNSLRPNGPQAADDEASGLNSEDYWRAIEEELNRSLDKEVETLVEGMEEVVGLASVGPADVAKASQDSLSISLRTETLIRACTNLLQLTHSLKMLWLLGDEGYTRELGERKRKEVRKEIKTVKEQVVKCLDGMKQG